ncbi:hypothetical protein [Geodermatophilus sp. DSM 45219]|uniref:hypothetical protein n=1 Tax=Geodermatophilus sp. DSM 45219 TaxID=1881103 RepID=UPI000885E811|nr:hypothetical protein [Geodermatophilus sp. DSM 45219]SDN47365.1 hypothetical protein SAMN05428965_0546 [Geodermatophilus sp. DSM 45219]
MAESPETVDQRWLRFELWEGMGVHNGLTRHIFREAARVEPLFNESAEWRAWWTSTSKAPALDLSIAVVWPDKTPPDDWFLPERIARGRKQHFVRLHLDAGRVEEVPKEARHALLLPTVLEALGRLVTKLKLSYPPEDLPDGVLRDG